MNKYRINNQIRAKEVKLIGAEGEYLGDISFEDAISKARELGLDLVEMNPNAKPPVCKISDYGKFVYRQAKEKKKQEAQQKKNKMKIIRIGVSTGEHDLEMKGNKIKKFIEDGDTVRVEMVLRGRQKAHRDIAESKIRGFLKTLESIVEAKYMLKRTPNGFSADLKAQK